MLHNIIEEERLVWEQYDKDKSDPEMYVRIKQLCEGILVLKKWCDNADEIDQVAHEAATDIYLRINGKEGKKPLEMYAWNRYLPLALKGYLRGYRYWNKEKQIFNISDPVLKEDFYQTYYSKLEVTDTDSIQDLIEEIPGLIQKTYDKYTRYYKDTKEYTDLLVSLYLSIYHDKVIMINNNINKSLLILLINIINNNIKSLLNNNNTEKSLSNNITDYIKLFELQVDNGGDSYD